MISFAKRRNIPVRAVSLIAMVLVLFQLGGFWLFYTEIRNDIHQQIQEEVKTENEEAIGTIKALVAAKMEWLDTASGMAGLARRAGKPDASSEDAWWDMLGRFDIDGEYRIGIADNQGTIYFGNHEKQDISNREYYQAAMNGRISISPIQEKNFLDANSIVIAAPILSAGKVPTGVFAIEYTALRLGHQLNSTDLTGYGVNLIVDANGKLVATHEGLEAYDTFFDMFRDRNLQDGYSLAEMQENVKSGRPGYLEYYHNGQKRILYYQSVGINDWTAVSIVADHSYYKILNQIEQKTTMFVIITLLIVTAGTLLALWLLFRQKEEIRKGKRDSLTGAYAREAGRKLVEMRFRNNQPRCCGCLFVDLDDLKQINDRYGHEDGDKVLKDAGEAIRNSVREDDIVYRFGGDEFCIWLYGNGGRDILESVAERILLNASYLDQRLSLSIGITEAAEGETDMEAIVKRADMALYEAKRAGKHRIRVI